MGEKLQAKAGRLNILVLCGGAIAHGQHEKAPLTDLDLMYRSNVRGHYALIQAMLPLLRKAQGQIVFVNSSAGLRSPATAGQFAATRHAFRDSDSCEWTVYFNARGEVEVYGSLK